MSVLSAQIDAVRRWRPVRITGVVAALRGLTVLVEDLPLPVGALVAVREPGGHGAKQDKTLGEVVGFTREHAIVMILGQSAGIRAGDLVTGLQTEQTAPVGERMLGRVVDGLGRPIDGLGDVQETTGRPINPEPIGAMERRAIREAMLTGVRAVDLMTTLGRGQRVGIFAGPGVGKSTLLGAIARGTHADISVIALIGERGREVRDFIENSLGPEGLRRSIVVVATSDESPLMRIRAALVACAAAEHFRERGRDVMLMMDSVTRFAHAKRQVGLSVGEPPATKGYTPSVFAGMALLLERAGAVQQGRSRGTGGREEVLPERVEVTSAGPPPGDAPSHRPAGRPSRGGSITGLYTILVEGDDMTEPISDAARGILDGHIVLSRKLAQRAHYPAIDVLDSVSRVADDVSDPAHTAARRQALRLLAVYRDVEDLVQIGAYARGSNPEADVAIEYQPRIMELLRQEKNDRMSFVESRGVLVKIALESAEALKRRLREKGR